MLAVTEGGAGGGTGCCNGGILGKLPSLGGSKGCPFAVELSNGSLSDGNLGTN